MIHCTDQGPLYAARVCRERQSHSESAVDTTPGPVNIKNTTRRQEMPVGGARGLFASGMTIFVFAIMPLLASAAVLPGRNAPQEKPRFASVELEIWPEFDRRDAVLVIVRGELAADSALPASVSLRIPASSTATAVAFSTAPRAELFNLEHERRHADDFTTLQFRTTHRFIQVEFYDRLVTDTSARRFTYIWPGDLAVDRLTVRVQEPAVARDLLMKPDLGIGVTGTDGLLYRAAELGALQAGKRLPIEIRYTKTDPRTSAEILGLKGADSKPPATTGSGAGFPGWLLIVIVSATLLIGVGAASLWWRRRAKATAARPGNAGFCHQCRSRLAADDRFCSKCGAPVRKS